MKFWVAACLAGLVLSHGAWVIANSERSLPKSLDYQTVVLQGTVSSLPEVSNNRTRFLFAARYGIVQVSWYQQAPIVKPGQIWRLKLKLKAPHGLHNPGLSDYADYLKQQGVLATAYVVTDPGNICLSDSIWHAPISRLRHVVKQQLLTASHGFALQGVFLALVLGDKSLISQSQWQVFWRTGTSHLVAISGLHIGLIAGLVYTVFRWFWAAVPALALRLAAQQAALLMAWLAAFIYSALAGFSVPTQRSLIMISVLLFARLSYRYVTAFQAWLLALCLVLAWNPYSLFAAGTWLSFAAVGMLLYSMSNRVQRPSRWQHWVYPQWAVFLGLLPISLYWFSQLTFTDIAVNSVAIPVMSFIIVPGLLITCVLLTIWPWLAALLMTIIIWVSQYLWQFMHYFAMLPYWGCYLTEPGLLASALAGIGAMYLLAPRAVPARWLGWILCLPVFAWQPPAIPTGEAQLLVFDVGQGLAVLLRTHSHVLIYDTGPSYPGGFSAGQSVLWPYLRRQGINVIDRLIISHGDNDHAGGAEAVVANFRVMRKESSDPDIKGVTPCRSGETWQWDGVDFTYLYAANDPGLSSNDRSCVLQISVGAQHILLPGDISQRIEKRLLKTEFNNLSADILIAPHHGSLSGSNEAFVQAVAPKYVVFATGYHNRFGFPRLAIMQRYANIGSRCYDTAENGAIGFTLSGSGPVTAPDLTVADQTSNQGCENDADYGRR